LQEDIINDILAKKDTLALLPTGGGKSICFQVPALALEGVCIVVSPLIALMKDQVQNLKSRGIRATALYSGMRKTAIDIALDNCIYGNIKFLYVSPERLSSDLFIARFKIMNVSFIAVDEAHCISQWGYDFRPAYMKIADLREIKPALAVLALTATATPKVVNDIQANLLFKEQNLLQKSFLRSNLSYSVLYESAKYTKLIDIFNKVNGSAIVYVQSRRKTKEVAELLTNNGIDATYYHAGLSNDVRDKRQTDWIQDKTRIIVATNAFGMGIDKSNVRVVVHLSLPDSPEAYFQEAGRAGRDSKKAYAVLLYNESDKLKKEKILAHNMPSIQEIKQVYESLGNFFQLAVNSGKDNMFSFDISAFCLRNNLGVIKVFNALKFLESEGYLVLSEAVNSNSKVLVKCTKRVLEEFLKRKSEHQDFFKNMLRTYGGMFEDFISIKESFLATKLNISIAEVKANLLFFDKQGLIIYQEQTDKPFIFFLEHRLDIKDLVLNVENITQRINTFELKHQAMLTYAESKTICRSKMLLSYFGELDSVNCGICDVCLERNKLKVSENDFKKMVKEIKGLLIDEPLALDELQLKLKINNPDKLFEIIKYLMNLGFVDRLKTGKLIWKN
jgi:ATP-dependent DNA helicase RecQ